MTARYGPSGRRESRFDLSAVRTLEAALAPPNRHSWVLTDAMSGRTYGVYLSEAQTVSALRRTVARGMVLVLTIAHPDGCGCPELAE